MPRSTRSSPSRNQVSLRPRTPTRLSSRNVDNESDSSDGFISDRIRPRSSHSETATKLLIRNIRHQARASSSYKITYDSEEEEDDKKNTPQKLDKKPKEKTPSKSRVKTRSRSSSRSRSEKKPRKRLPSPIPLPPSESRKRRRTPPRTLPPPRTSTPTKSSPKKPRGRPSKIKATDTVDWKARFSPVVHCEQLSTTKVISMRSLGEMTAEVTKREEEMRKEEEEEMIIDNDPRLEEVQTIEVVQEEEGRPDRGWFGRWCSIM